MVGPVIGGERPVIKRGKAVPEGFGTRIDPGHKLTGQERFDLWQAKGEHDAPLYHQRRDAIEAKGNQAIDEALRIAARMADRHTRRRFGECAKS